MMPAADRRLVLTRIAIAVSAAVLFLALVLYLNGRSPQPKSRISPAVTEEQQASKAVEKTGAADKAQGPKPNRKSSYRSPFSSITTVAALDQLRQKELKEFIVNASKLALKIQKDEPKRHAVMEAVRACAESGTAPSLEILTMALALGMSPGEDITALLRTVLNSQGHVDLRTVAVYGLGMNRYIAQFYPSFVKIRTRWLTEYAEFSPLLTEEDRKDLEFRLFQMLFFDEQIEDAESVKDLVRAVINPNEPLQIRRAAIAALSEMASNTEVRTALESALAMPDLQVDVAWVVGKALGGKSPHDILHLAQILRSTGGSRAVCELIGFAMHSETLTDNEKESLYWLSNENRNLDEDAELVLTAARVKLQTQAGTRAFLDAASGDNEEIATMAMLQVVLGGPDDAQRRAALRAAVLDESRSLLARSTAAQQLLLNDPGPEDAEILIGFLEKSLRIWQALPPDQRDKRFEPLMEHVRQNWDSLIGDLRSRSGRK